MTPSLRLGLAVLVAVLSVLPACKPKKPPFSKAADTTGETVALVEGDPSQSEGFYEDEYDDDYEEEEDYETGEPVSP
jgi:hypothetical protein